MSFRLTEQAERDFDDIYFTGAERFGLNQAERYAAALVEKFNFLAEHPEATRLRTEIDPPARAYPYKAHIIVYDVTPERDVVIVRIRGGREDWLSDARREQ